MIIYNPAYQHSTDKPVERERDSAEALPDHDPTHVQLTLQMLGLMCDGQNHTLQVYAFNKWTLTLLYFVMSKSRVIMCVCDRRKQNSADWCVVHIGIAYI